MWMLCSMDVLFDLILHWDSKIWITIIFFRFPFTWCFGNFLWKSGFIRGKGKVASFQRTTTSTAVWCIGGFTMFWLWEIEGKGLSVLYWVFNGAIQSCLHLFSSQWREWSCKMEQICEKCKETMFTWSIVTCVDKA